MMATTFGHNFNFAAAKQNGEAFQQFPSHGLSLCLPLSRTLFLSVGQKWKFSFSQTVSKCFLYISSDTFRERCLAPHFYANAHAARRQSWTKCHHFRWECCEGQGSRNKEAGVPWAKRAQASTTTRMTSRSSRRLSATATATSDARKGLTKRKAMEMLLLLEFSAKNFWCKSSENERSGRNNIKYMYICIYRCGWVSFLGSIRDPGPLNAAHGS